MLSVALLASSCDTLVFCCRGFRFAGGEMARGEDAFSPGRKQPGATFTGRILAPG